MPICKDSQIIVGISGAPGVGKTTLVDSVYNLLSSTIKVAASREVARTLLREGVRINTESQTEDYLAFLATYIKNMRLLKGDLVLFDRTILDVFAFMKLNGHDKGWLKILVEQLMQWQMSFLSIYFYIPPEFQPVSDGVRIVDPAIINTLDASILQLLRLYRPDFTTLTGTIAQRLDTMLKEIHRVGLSAERVEK